MRMLTFSRRTAREVLRDPLTVLFGLGFPLVLLGLLTAIQKNIPVPLFALESLTPGVAVFGTTGEEDKVVNKAEAANAPENPSSPHKFRDTVIGGVAGVVIVSAIIIAVHLMDNTIKTSDDIEKYLGLSALGVIPISEEEANAKTKKKKARAKG